MKVKVYFRRNLKESYSIAVVHVPDGISQLKNWLKRHLKDLGIQANYLIYEEM